MNARSLLGLLAGLAISVNATGAGNKPATLTPVATVKAFLAALADADSEKLKALAMPNRKLKSLYSPPLPEEAKSALRTAAGEDLAVLRPGSQIPMEDGMMTVPPSHNVALVYGGSMLYPIPVHRVEGVWKVNVAPMIAAREKAAKLAGKTK